MTGVASLRWQLAGHVAGVAQLYIWFLAGRGAPAV